MNKDYVVGVVIGLLLTLLAAPLGLQLPVVKGIICTQLNQTP